MVDLTLPSGSWSSKIDPIRKKSLGVWLTKMIKTVEWTNEGIRMIDQRLLPGEEKYLMLRSCEEVADAIKTMAVRGAPAIAVSAAMGLALGPPQSVGLAGADLEHHFYYICEIKSNSPPTTIHL